MDINRRSEAKVQTEGNVATRVLAPQQAVQEYLDALLQDATAQAHGEPEVMLAQPEAEVVEVAVEVAVVEPVVAVETVTAVDQQTAAAVVAEPKHEVGVWKDGRPAWAQEKFECLLFSVSGLTLAVPLKELGGVLTMDADLNPLFGQPDWFLGLLPSKTAGTVKTIDTARWVMPEKYTELSRDGLKYVILMEGTGWGMACHEVAEAISLEPHQVKWRSERSRRPWLAGTVVEHMCAIMDVSALVELLSADSLKIKAPQWTKQHSAS
ncbi:MAG: chemotaxis protein CheW [Motiliproteus sp.]